MIDSESFSPEWISKVAEEHNIGNRAIVERVIHAFALVELLSVSGLDFVFKGGTCIMLLFPDELNRMSVDVDIVCPPGTDILQHLSKHADYGFTRIDGPVRHPATGINLPAAHAKLRYNLAFPMGHSNSSHIVLDVLYADCHYNQTKHVPIAHGLLMNKGEPFSVRVPTAGNLLVDKLTAYAPHTSGIPFVQEDRERNAEIIKQLYDVGRLFDKIGDDISSLSGVFGNICRQELSYKTDTGTIDSVYSDIRGTSLCLSCEGDVAQDEYRVLFEGVHLFRKYLYHGKSYNATKAVADAAKAAYLATAIQRGKPAIEHYRQDANMPEPPDNFAAVLHKRLLKLKKGNPEAFFYWVKVAELLQA